MPRKEKWSRIKKRQRDLLGKFCQICLTETHTTPDCRRSTCNIEGCNRAHHPLLHSTEQRTPAQNQSRKQSGRRPWRNNGNGKPGNGWNRRRQQQQVYWAPQMPAPWYPPPGGMPMPPVGPPWQPPAQPVVKQPAGKVSNGAAKPVTLIPAQGSPMMACCHTCPSDTYGGSSAGSSADESQALLA
jgi:hypothetical protein